MPLKHGTSDKTASSNIRELAHGKPGAAREKAIRTYMLNNDCSYEEAKQKVDIAIAMSMKRNPNKGR